MKIRRLLILVLLPVILASCNFSLAEDITPPPGYRSPTPPQAVEPLFPSEPAQPARGAVIYSENCVQCHGEDGLGNGPRAAGLPVAVSAIGFEDIAQLSSPAEWFAVVTYGREDRYMPSYENLSAEERWDVIAYVFSLSMPAEQVARGQTVYSARCAACHGSTATGNGPSASGLSNSPADLTNQALMAQSAGLILYQTITDGVAPDMPAFDGVLSEQDIWDLTVYLRSLTFDYSQTASVPASTPASTEVVIPPVSTEEAAPAGTALESTATLESLGTPQVEGVPATQSAAGTVTGAVSNGSGGLLPEGLVATLRGFTSGFAVYVKETPVDPQGLFIFSDVPQDTSITFLVSVDYASTTYTSDVAAFDGTTDAFNLDVVVYDTTTDAAVLTIDRMHMFFQFTTPDTLQVIELFIISNASNLALVAEQPGQPVVSIPLPEGATNLTFRDGNLGERFVQTENGFADTMGVVPGSATYQILFAFDLPYDRRIDLSQQFDYPLASTLVMVPEGVKLRGEGLVDEGLRDVQGNSFQVYSRENLASGGVLELSLSGLPKSQSALNLDSKTSLVIGLAGFGTLLILAGVIIYFRGRSRDMQEEDVEEDNLDDAESIMDAIIALDEQYKAGAISPQVYKKRRAELKARLKDLV